MTKRLIILLSFILASLVVGVVYFMLQFGLFAKPLSYLVAPIEFNHEAWLAEGAVGPGEDNFAQLSIRQRMVSSLEQRLSEMSKSELTELLGEPDYVTGNGMTIWYKLGLQRGFGFDMEWLQVQFDETGVYVSHVVAEV